MGTRHGWTSMFAILAMLGCGARDQGSGEKIDTMGVVKPGDLERMIYYPNDGRINVQLRGKFYVKSNTFFCILDPIYSEEMRGFTVSSTADLERLLISVRQWDNVGVDQGRGLCTQTPGAIYLQHRVILNGNNKPYAVSLTAWQNYNAAWVGKVARQDGRRPPKNGHHNLPQESPSASTSESFESLRLDIEALQDKFMSLITKQ